MSMLGIQAENTNAPLCPALSFGAKLVVTTAVVSTVFNFIMGLGIQNETPASQWVIFGALGGFSCDFIGWACSLPGEGSPSKTHYHRALLSLLAVKPLSQVTSFCVALFSVKTAGYRDVMLVGNTVLFLLSLLGLVGLLGCSTSEGQLAVAKKEAGAYVEIEQSSRHLQTCKFNP